VHRVASVLASGMAAGLWDRARADQSARLGQCAAAFGKSRCSAEGEFEPQLREPEYRRRRLGLSLWIGRAPGVGARRAKQGHAQLGQPDLRTP